MATSHHHDKKSASPTLKPGNAASIISIPFEGDGIPRDAQISYAFISEQQVKISIEINKETFALYIFDILRKTYSRIQPGDQSTTETTQSARRLAITPKQLNPIILPCKVIDTKSHGSYVAVKGKSTKDGKYKLYCYNEENNELVAISIAINSHFLWLIDGRLAFTDDKLKLMLFNPVTKEIEPVQTSLTINFSHTNRPSNNSYALLENGFAVTVSETVKRSFSFKLIKLIDCYSAKNHIKKTLYDALPSMAKELKDLILSYTRQCGFFKLDELSSTVELIFMPPRFLPAPLRAEMLKLYDDCDEKDAVQKMQKKALVDLVKLLEKDPTRIAAACDTVKNYLNDPQGNPRTLQIDSGYRHWLLPLEDSLIPGGRLYELLEKLKKVDGKTLTVSQG